MTIPGLTRFGRIKQQTIHLKTDIPMMPFLHHSKDWTIGCFQTPIGMRTIESSGVTVFTIITDEAIELWIVLLTALHTCLLLLGKKGPQATTLTSATP